MARNAEVVRQWEILRAIDATRTGMSVARLAGDRQVHPRTIRRDLEALGRAGFPLYDETINGTPMWKLRGRPFRFIEESGLGLTELAALYFSRSMLIALAGPVFQDELETALMKLERALPPACRKFVDGLPRVVNAKSNGRKKADGRKLRDIVARAFDAIARQRRVTMRYASASSSRTKDYVVEPQRVTYADGGVYLSAWVPEYRQPRTFSIERIETLAQCDETFAPRPLPGEPFANSLGVHTGLPEPVEIEFDAEVADYVRGREWHRSQDIEDRADGSIVLRLEVSIDDPLRRWVLGFGASALVVAPLSLAREIREEFDGARALYWTSRLAMVKMSVGSRQSAGPRPRVEPGRGPGSGPPSVAGAHGG